MFSRRTSLPFSCPAEGCRQLRRYELEEVSEPGGGILMRPKPCPKCGHTEPIGRLTKRGVDARRKMQMLRSLKSPRPSVQAELGRLQQQYDKEYTALVK